MQATHLKFVSKTNILATLKSFQVGESEIIPFSESKVDTTTFRSRYAVLRNNGNLQGEFRFLSSKDPVGTLIIRIK